MELIKNKYYLSYEYNKNIVNTCKRDIKKIKINNRRSLIKQQKSKEDQILYIKECWQDKIGIHYTLSSIRNSLFVKFPDIKNILLSTIAKCKKHKLNTSFKKPNKIILKM